jgi:hypothetical protein
MRFFALTGAGALLAQLLAAANFRRRTDALIARLERATPAESRRPPIPEIVQSFARRAAPDNLGPRTVRLRQSAEMRAQPGDPWRRLVAEQVIGVHEPGFVWLARVCMAPLLYAHVLDCYVGGEGFVEVRLFGSLRVARADGPQIAKGELMRYLAELAWAPLAVLHNPHLSWREIGAATVEVSAASADGPARVRLVFENGDIIRIEADDRPRAIRGQTVPTPWCGRFFDCREIGGWRIPTSAVVSWILEEGPFECWRGRVTEFRMGDTRGR